MKVSRIKKEHHGLGNIPFLVLLSSNLIDERIFLHDPNPCDLVSFFFDDLFNLATQSSAQMKMNFFQFDTVRNCRHLLILESPYQRRSPCVGIEAEDNNSENSSTQLLQLQKNQLLDLQEQFDTHCNILAVCGFSSARYDTNLMKSYQVPIFASKRDIEPIVIKKSQTICFLQIWWCSSSWHFELFRRCYLSWFVPESLQDNKEEKIFSIQMVQPNRQTEWHRGSSIQSFSQ